MNKQRILFMGTPGFAVGSLNALVEAGLEVAAVVTAPDRPAGRGQQVRMSPVKERAVQLSLPVLQPERLRDPDFLQELDRINADLYIVVAFRMLPEVVWSKPALGTINLHGSLLPQYRGAAPINWAIMNGETTTGVSTFFLRHEIDTGDIIDQEAVSIGEEDNAGQVHDRLMHVGADLLVRTVRSILSGTAARTAQPVDRTTEELHHAPKLDKATCRIDWERSAKQVHDHVRGLSPFPGAWTEIITPNGAISFKVLATRTNELNAGDQAGSIRADAGRLLVSCGSGSIELLEVQPEGRRRMSAAEFLRGAGSITTMRFR